VNSVRASIPCLARDSTCSARGQTSGNLSLGWTAETGSREEYACPSRQHSLKIIINITQRDLVCCQLSSTDAMQHYCRTTTWHSFGGDPTNKIIHC